MGAEGAGWAIWGVLWEAAGELGELSEPNCTPLFDPPTGPPFEM